MNFFNDLYNVDIKIDNSDFCVKNLYYNVFID